MSSKHSPHSLSSLGAREKLPIDPLELEDYFSAAFNRPIICCITDELLGRDELTETEIIQLAQYKNERRRSSWLRGRRALKILMREIEFADQHAPLNTIDTTATFFPHPAFSLSHSRDIAIAISCLAPAFGVGLDLEFIKETKTQMSRFYLSEDERGWLDKLSDKERSIEQIRLWTAKEAIFKSDLNNENRTLLSYQLADPRANSGKARVRTDEKYKADYSSRRFGDCWISIAISHSESKNDTRSEGELQND